MKKKISALLAAAAVLVCLALPAYAEQDVDSMYADIPSTFSIVDGEFEWTKGLTILQYNDLVALAGEHGIDLENSFGVVSSTTLLVFTSVTNWTGRLVEGVAYNFRLRDDGITFTSFSESRSFNMMLATAKMQWNSLYDFDGIATPRQVSWKEYRDYYTVVIPDEMDGADGTISDAQTIINGIYKNLPELSGGVIGFMGATVQLLPDWFVAAVCLSLALSTVLIFLRFLWQ